MCFYDFQDSAEAGLFHDFKVWVKLLGHLRNSDIKARVNNHSWQKLNETQLLKNLYSFSLILQNIPKLEGDCVKPIKNSYKIVKREIDHNYRDCAKTTSWDPSMLRVQEVLDAVFKYAHDSKVIVDRCKSSTKRWDCEFLARAYYKVAHNDFKAVNKQAQGFISENSPFV